MALSMRTSPDEFRRRLEQKYNAIMQDIAEALFMTCTEAVNRARSLDTYKDQTNNLRSSLGFVIYHNGRMLFRDFQTGGTGTGGGGQVSFTTSQGQEVSFSAQVKSDTSGNRGLLQGEALANSVAQRYPSGFIAVIVAGMNYALFVEAKGYDVLTGSTLTVGEDLKKNLEIINNQYGTSFGAFGQGVEL